MFRQTVRVIGDDSNLIREFPPLPGRVYSVAISDDGKRIAAGSSLDGTGEIGVYAYEFDTGLPANIKAINEKVVTARRPRKPPRWRSITRRGSSRSRSVKVPQGGIYAVAFRPDGKVLAAAGADGMIRLLNPETGSLVKEFAAGRRSRPPRSPRTPRSRPSRPSRRRAVETEVLPKGASLAALEVQPKEIRLTNRFAYAQLLVTGKLASGETIDVTRMVEPSLSAAIAEVSRSGLVRPRADGKATLTLRLAGKTAEVPVTVLGVNTPRPGRLRPRRRAGALAARLQLGDLPRLGPGQERLQALAPRLRPDLRRARPDRRPGRRGTSTSPRPTTA